MSISQKPLYTLHENKDIKSSTSTTDNRVKNSSSAISYNVKDKIESHIESFTKTKSHYNRTNTKKSYLESILNLPIISLLLETT